MALPRLALNPIDISAFLAILDAEGGEAGLELIEGEVVAMAGGTENHEQIVANIAAPLKIAMDRRDCRTLIGGMLVRKADRDDMAAAPDILVRCGPALGRQRFIEDPVAIVEVLSPSTLEYDRGFKLAFYKTLPTLASVAIVYQDEMRVEAWERAGDVWAYRVLSSPDDRMGVPSLDFALTLAEVYRGVSFDDAAGARTLSA